VAFGGTRHGLDDDGSNLRKMGEAYASKGRGKSEFSWRTKKKLSELFRSWGKGTIDETTKEIENSGEVKGQRKSSGTQ